jgi:Na+/melibiose symporter-like transporter
MVVAVMLPAVFIPDFNDPQYRGNYVIAAIFMAIFLGFWGFVFIKWGLKEKPEFSKDAEAAPSVFGSFKYSLKSKSFRRYVVANFFAWYTLGMVAVFPAYVAFVIGVSDTALIGLVTVVMLIFFALFGPVWKKITLKVGVRKAMIYSFLIWGFSQIPYLFIQDYPSMLIISVISGIGLSGVSYLQRIIMAVIVDEDELNTGVRREAGFWGINYFIIRLSTIAVFLSIGLVFASVDWLIYGGEASVTPEMILGLRLLRGLLTFVGLMIGVVFMILFPISKEVNEQIAQDVRKLHVEKKAKVSG